MSAQQVADECEKRGLPIKRSVLANLESGRRTTLSVPELLILADVLGVPPIVLLFPLGYVSRVRVLPGAAATPEQAMGWFGGTLVHADDPASGENSVVLFSQHAYAVSSWQEARRLAERRRRDAVSSLAGSRQPAATQAEEYEATRRRMEFLTRTQGAADRDVEAAVSLVRSIRRKMRLAGMTVLPALPEGLDALSEFESPREEDT